VAVGDIDKALIFKHLLCPLLYLSLSAQFKTILVHYYPSPQILRV